jgi:hypothetical protein
VSTTLSCGQCGSPVRADQTWCSLCYARIEEEFDPLTAPLNVVMGRQEVPESQPPVEAPTPRPEAPELVVQALPPTDVESPEESDSTLEAAEVSDVDVMLSMLAAEHRRSDPAAGLADQMTDKSTRIMVMVGGTLLIAGLVFLAFTVLGAIF